LASGIKLTVDELTARGKIGGDICIRKASLDLPIIQKSAIIVIKLGESNVGMTIALVEDCIILTHRFLSKA